MIFFDMFFYMIFRFSNQTLKRDMDNATLSGAAILTVYIGFFAGTTVCIIGLIKDNAVSHWFLENAFLASLPIGFICYILFIIRYFKFINADDIKKKIAELSNRKRIIIKTTIWFFVIAVPVGIYVFGRLYKFGYV